ncbi:MAG TPA: TonB family protein [Mucilaginibacter sp.]|jgi:TonB family protein
MTWWQYLMLVNVYLLLFYGFYVLLLSRETFFQLNRIYLVSAALLSFFIPLIQSDWAKNLFITQEVKYTIYSGPVMLYSFKPMQDTQITIGQILAIIYLAGITFLLARLIWQLVALNKVIDQAQSSPAYSFFKKIKLGDDFANHDIIAAHENVHASQWHSADVLIIEAVTILNWFNPVVYLYRFAIKHIHEFIADRQALKAGTDKADYALLLLSQTFNAPAHRLVNPFFNKSLLKQRILMLQKNKSHRVALIKYGLTAPLFVLMLILSSATVNNSKTIRLLNKKAGRIFLIPAGESVDIKTNTSQFKGATIVEESQSVASKGSDKNKSSLLTKKDTIPAKDDKVFTSVEQVPEFPGGIEAFGAFLSKNIRYPAEMRRNKVQGRVIISFVVETDGTLSNFRIARDLGYGAGEESVRVLALSPKWKPGIQNGKTVRVAYSVPISFTLEDSQPVKSSGNKTGAVNENKSTVNSVVVLNNDNKAATDTNKNPADLHLNGFVLSPLIIIDGKEADNGLSSLNPNDIESISVLKDKSATALYGPKGANGVVLVVTKKNILKILKINPVAPAKN